MARELTDAGVPEVGLTVAIEINGERERVEAIYHCAIGLAVQRLVGV